MNRLAIMMVLAAAAAGCKKSVKVAEVETWMKQRTVELGINATKVSCPKDIAPKEGTSFDCAVEVEGKPYILTGTITKVESSKVNFDTSWKDGKNGVVIRSKLAPLLADELGKQLGAKVDVTCAEPLMFLDDKRAVSCNLTAGATKAKVVVTFDDKLVPTGWKLDPMLLSKAKLEELLTPSVREKTAPDVVVTCGTQALLPRAADGMVVCDVTGSKTGKIKVDVDADLNVKRWDPVQ